MQPNPLSEDKFTHYLNQEINKMKNSKVAEKVRLSKVLQSPIPLPRNMSQNSIDSLFYDP